MRDPYLADWIALALVALIILVVVAIAIGLLVLVFYALDAVIRRPRRR